MVSVIKADPLPLALLGCTYLAADNPFVKLPNLISSKRVSLPNSGKQKEAKGCCACSYTVVRILTRFIHLVY